MPPLPPSDTPYTALHESSRSSSVRPAALIAVASLVALGMVLVLPDAFSTVIFAHTVDQPPQLCYEFTATVLKRTTETGEAEHVGKSYTRGFRVSRASDFVGMLQFPAMPYEKEFRVWYTAGEPSKFASENHSRRTCVSLNTLPFFDETICEIERSKHDHFAGCSAHYLQHIMPLDASYGERASRAYVDARRVGAPDEVDGVQLWQWDPPARTMLVKERGAHFNASVLTVITYRIARAGSHAHAPACDNSGAAAYMLLGTTSTVTTTLECVSSAAVCDAAHSEDRRVSSYRTETRFEPSMSAAVMGKPPKLGKCVDGRYHERPADSGLDHEPPAHFVDVSGGGEAYGWDAHGWDEATGRDGADGSANGWAAPPAYVLSTMVDVVASDAINAQHGRTWHASAGGYMDGATYLARQDALGTEGLVVPADGLLLPTTHPSRLRTRSLPASPHLGDLHLGFKGTTSSDDDTAALPERFDAREAWPACAEQIGRVRNQGSCGSCWAQAAAGSLSDRLCIASSGVLSVDLSAQSMMDCDQVCDHPISRYISSGSHALPSEAMPFPTLPSLTCTCHGAVMTYDQHDDGCHGGYLDNAWRYLVTEGLPSDKCVPYRFCENWRLPNCSFDNGGGRHASPPPLAKNHSRVVAPPPPTPPPLAPPSPAPPLDVCTQCAEPNGVASAHRYRAASAYAVAPVGDVRGIMLELMAHGPIAVSFHTFSDFYLYERGVYQRTPAGRLMGGHAVRLIGWGTAHPGEPGLENATTPVPYWTVANSWSPNWGEGGFFRIRRGTNEVEIETTPAAGLPRV